MSETQLSVALSATTKERLDRFTQRSGLKKNFVVEQALLFFMEARRELPDEAFVPTRLVLEPKAFDAIASSLAQPAPATPALRELLRGTRG
jgi:hypothetical protein